MKFGRITNGKTARNEGGRGAVPGEPILFECLYCGVDIDARGIQNHERACAKKTEDERRGYIGILFR